MSLIISLSFVIGSVSFCNVQLVKRTESNLKQEYKMDNIIKYTPCTYDIDIDWNTEL